MIRKGVAFYRFGEVNVEHVPRFQGSGPTGYENLGRRSLCHLTGMAAARCLLDLLVHLRLPQLTSSRVPHRDDTTMTSM